MPLLMGIDIGTSAVKCLIGDEKGTIWAKSRQSYGQLIFKPGYVEQNPNVWWESVIIGIKDCLSFVEKQELLGNETIVAISCSGQMTAPVLLDKEGNVISNAILIADTRSREESDFLNRNFLTDFLESTGNRPEDAFAVSKLLWIKNHQPDVYNQIDKVIFPKDYIRFKLTDILATDRTDAGNSLLYDYHKGVWNKDLIEKVGLPFSWFPPLMKATDSCGVITSRAAVETGLKKGITVICGAADMACTQIGISGLDDKILSLTLSTSIQILASTTEFHGELVGKITYHPCVFRQNFYAMASIFSGGMSVDWLYRLLYDVEDISPEAYQSYNEAITKRYRAAPYHELYFLPYLTGSGSPFFNPQDRGAFLGLSPAVAREDLALAVFEGIGFNIRENVELLESQLGKFTTIHLGGGGSGYSVWIQILSDILNRPIQVMEEKDVASIGALILAGIGVELLPGLQESWHRFNHLATEYFPIPDNVTYLEQKYNKFKKVYKALSKT